jgi:hypothetical protein
MLVLFLLNALGYYGILQGFKAKSMIAWETAETGEGLGSTVTFKIPLTVPYGVDSGEYQKTEGQFEYNGEVYQLVKQKLEKDVLYIVCAKDETSSMWGRAIADYVMSFSDTQDDSSESSAVQPNLIKDFISLSIALTRQTDGWHMTVPQSGRIAHFADTFCASFVHPPERA